MYIYIYTGMRAHKNMLIESQMLQLCEQLDPDYIYIYIYIHVYVYTIYTYILMYIYAYKQVYRRTKICSLSRRCCSCVSNRIPTTYIYVYMYMYILYIHIYSCVYIHICRYAGAQEYAH